MNKVDIDKTLLLLLNHLKCNCKKLIQKMPLAKINATHN